MGGQSSKGYQRVENEQVQLVQVKVDGEAGAQAYASINASTDDQYVSQDGRIFQKSLLFNTDPKVGLPASAWKQRLADFGPNKLTEKKSNPYHKLALEFVQPMPCVVWAAIVIEAIECAIDWPGNSATSDLIDVFVLLLLQMLNVFVGWIEELKSQDAIAKLKESLNPKANVLRDGVADKIDASLLVPGDIVCIESGGAIPADCQILPGSKPIQVDQSAMTGESLPVTFKAGGIVKMGSTMKSGKADAIVIATGSQTFFGKTAEMIAGVEGMGHFDKVLQEMLVVLVTVGCAVMLTVFIYLLTIGENFKEVLSFCVVLLIASIPIALKVVCTTTLALGAGELAKEKAIVARLSSIEELAGLTVLCSDKTGTLTLNKMIIKEDLDPSNPADVAELNNLESGHPGRKNFHRIFSTNPDTKKDFTRQEMLNMAAMATVWTEPAKDAIDTMILDKNGRVDFKLLKDYEHLDFDPFDPSTKRTMATLRNKKTGKMFRVAKGATKVMLDMCESEHRERIQKVFTEEIDSFAHRGIRAIAIIRTEDVELDKEGKATDAADAKGWRMVGFLTFLDPPREDTAHVIAMAKKFGVEVKMITGDAGPIAIEMCKTIGLGHNILIGEKELEELPVQQLMKADWLGDKFGDVCLESNGFAQVLPEHKFLIVEALRQQGYLVGMCGDGVNDAPALKRADVGIAVQGATDAAQASSDIVLTEPGLSTIVTAMVVSRKIFTRMKNFVIYRVACTEQLLFFFLISCIAFKPSDHAPDGANMDDWPDYFSLPVIALVTITILNDGTIISVAYDNVEASLEPEAWNLKIMYWVASVIGLVALASSLVLLQLGLDSTKGGDHGLCAFGLDPMSFGEIQTMMYLKISLSDYCSVFNSRTRSWCWSRKPHNVVIGAALLAVTAATFLSAYWPFESGMKGISWDVILFVWIYVLVWSLVQDACKVLNGKLLARLGFIEDLGIINEDELSAPTEAQLLTDSANYGTRIERRPSRRRTMSTGDYSEGSARTAGFIDANYEKNDGKGGRVMIPSSALQDCPSTLHPEHDVAAFNPNIEGSGQSKYNKDAMGRSRHYSVDEEPSHMNAW